MKQKTQSELQYLTNALSYFNLKGYTVRQEFTTDKRKSVGKYFILDDKGTSLTGSWDYAQLNHFIIGYGKAYQKFNHA